MYEYKAKVTNVVDGDTIDVILDLGLQISVTHRLRLLGINCPEKFGVSAPEGLKAKDYAVSRLLDQDVVIHTEKDDAFGRYLATVYVNGVNFNRELLDKGYAVVYKRK